MDLTERRPLPILDAVHQPRWLAVVPVLLVGVILTCDALIARGSGAILTTGLLDEPAHFSTALLVLLALCPLPWLLRRWAPAAVVLASAMLIDLDHIPLYAGVPGIAHGGRPVTHSLATVCVLLVVAALVGPRTRRWFIAVAAGVCLHFVRDIATGPGLMLWWPVSQRPVLLPYALYAAVVVGLAALAVIRLVIRR